MFYVAFTGAMFFFFLYSRAYYCVLLFSMKVLIYDGVCSTVFAIIILVSSCFCEFDVLGKNETSNYLTIP